MKNINLLIISVILCFFLSSSFAQSDICGENPTGVYWPVKTGVKMHYYSPSGTHFSYFNGDSLRVGENLYFKEIKEYASGRKEELYLREQNGDVYIYDTEKKVEFLELSKNITPGYVWEKYDRSWKYTVIDTIATLSTPYCEYKQLLNIKAEPQGKIAKGYSSFYNLYYKRGIGFVGLDIDGKHFSFLTIDKSQVEEKNYVIAGCETESSEKQKRTCTAIKINEFVSKNFSYDGKIKRGKLSLGFTISEKGDVENVSVEEAINNAEGQTAEAIRVVKLMKFTPRQVNGKPIKTSVIVPISF